MGATGYLYRSREHNHRVSDSLASTRWTTQPQTGPCITCNIGESTKEAADLEQIRIVCRIFQRRR